MSDNYQKEGYKKWIYVLLIILFAGSTTVLMIHHMIKSNEVWQPMGDAEIQIIDRGSEWFYTRPKTDPQIGNVWATDVYDIESWESGDGSFSTNQNDQADNYLSRVAGEKEGSHSVFFRSEFTLNETLKDNILAMTGRIQYKAAAIVYLNGTIIYTGNIPAGGYQSNLEAGAAEDTKEINDATFQVTDLSMLREGKNILAVEIHSVEDDEIYFSFSDFALLKNEIEEKNYDTKNLILSKGEKTDEICVNYISASEGSYRVEYLEKSRYKEETDFALYGKTAYMGTFNIDGQWLSTVKLERLKENMEYVYRILRVGAKEGAEVYSFTTGKVEKSSFAVISLPTMEENTDFRSAVSKWREKVTEVVSKLEKGAFIVLLCQDEFGNRVFMEDTDLWAEIPCVYICDNAHIAKTSSGLELLKDQFRLQYRDMDIVCVNHPVQNPNCFTNERKWKIGIGLDKEEMKSDLYSEADLIFTVDDSGELLLSYKKEESINELNTEVVVIKTGTGVLQIGYEQHGTMREVSIEK